MRTVLLATTAVLALTSSAVAKPFVYVANRTGNSISIIDPASNTVSVNVATGTPNRLAAAPNGEFVYATSFKYGWMVTIRTADRTVFSATQPEKDFLFEGIALSPDGGTAYVTRYKDANVDSTMPGWVLPIDPKTDAVGAPIPVGSQARGIAITPDGGFAYVTNQNAATVSVIDLSTSEVVETIPVGAGPRGVVITKDGTTAYVASHAAGTISVIHTADKKVVDTITVGGGPDSMVITPDQSRLYATNATAAAGAVSVVDLGTRDVGPSIVVGTDPQGIAIMPDGSRAYVVNNNPGGPGTVSVIDTTRNTVVATIQLVANAGPRGVTIADVPEPPTPTPSPTATPAPPTATLVPGSCVGDCDDNGEVTVDELTTGVKISLGTFSLAQCPRSDADGDQTVTVDELVRAVGNALAGCRPAPH